MIELPDNRPLVIFPKPESVGKRDWGEELLLVLSSGNYTMKKISLLAGKKGGLQYHRFKDEAGYIISGRLLLKYEEIKGELIEKELGPGDCFHFPVGSVHQEIALTDVELIEVSTPYFNDRVRVEHCFDLQDSSGLPTTCVDDVIKK